MVSFADVSVTDPTAHAMLVAYFQERTESFPPKQGGYSTTFPDEAQFVPPAGVFLIAYDEDDRAAGCGGVRSLPTDAHTITASGEQAILTAPAVRYEIKHLWVEPGHRGFGLGRAILFELEDRARGFGATELVLDTNASLEAAGGLYQSSGYVDVEPYNDNPNATNWYRKEL